MPLYTLLLLLPVVSGCERHPNCDHSQVDAALNCVVRHDSRLIEVADRMQVFCVEDTRGSCLHDVDACTIGIGTSELFPGRMIAHTRVPVGNAIAHEAAHWSQMVRHQCTAHTASCGWKQVNVDTCSVYETTSIDP